ncbi:putative mariner [Trichonephila clavata]|uniref:Putative mariner n=1 Tax=Trichonephila clavata TaxID=2740835 RepID=A0A8X6KSY7_TRICU|nr:putative mariner [Trichonephila clavata]
MGNEFLLTAPSRLTIYLIKDKFETTSSVANALKSGRPRTTLTQENQMKATLTFVNSPKKSTRQGSREMGIPKTSLQLLMYQQHLKPFHPRLLHRLFENDPDSRLQFCEIMCNQLTEQPDLLSKFMWTFKLSGHVDKHNSVHWAVENLHVIMTTQLYQPGIIAWGGTSCNGVVGPIFFDGTVDDPRYLDMLIEAVVLQLQA